MSCMSYLFNKRLKSSFKPLSAMFFNIYLTFIYMQILQRIPRTHMTECIKRNNFLLKNTYSYFNYLCMDVK